MKSNNIQALTIISVAILLRLIYQFIIPPNQTPDEEFFFERVWSNVLNWTNPNLLASHKIDYPNNEYYYPPFYFFISAVFVRFISFFSSTNIVNFNEVFTANNPLFGLLGFLFYSAILFLIWGIIKRLNLDKRIALSVFTFTALLPSFVASTIFFNPNVLLHFFVFLTIYFLIDERINSFKKNLILATTVGLAILTKFEALSLLIIVPFFNFLNHKNKQFFTSSTLFLTVALLIGGWWYVLNFINTGWFYDRHLFAASIQSNITPFSFNNYLKGLFSWTFETFFATYGAKNNIRLAPSGYVVTGVLISASIIGALIGLRNFLKNDLLKRLYLTLAVLFIFNLAIFLQLNLAHSFQPQGRYLFPSLLLISLTITLGISKFFKGKLLDLLPTATLAFLLFFHLWSVGCITRYFYTINLTPTFLKCVFFVF